MQPPYPYDGMVCGLIHEAPSSVEDVRHMLRFAWFPAQGDVGEHTYWAEDAIEWTSSPISKDMGALLHLTDHAAYERHRPTTEGHGRLRSGHRPHWTTPGHPTHVLRRSPEGDRLLLIEEAGGEDGIALKSRPTASRGSTGRRT